MIYVMLMGGLGNQLFQYAAGQVQATRLNVPLKVYFEDHYKLATRSYALGAFLGNEIIASKQEVSHVLPQGRIVRTLNRIIGKSSHNRIFREKEHYVYDDAINAVSDETMLIGFWQSYKYVMAQSEFLREKLKCELGDLAKKRYDEIRRCKSVAIHIRRGDYLIKDSGFSTLGLDYYRNGIALIRENIGDCDFFVFSDDNEWVRQNAESFGTKLNIPEGETSPHEDLMLMSACNHQIIANSSFSWWAAFLNANTGKIVVAPRNWSVEVESSNSDLLPPDWRLI